MGDAGGGEADSSGTQHHNHTADMLIGGLYHERGLGMKSGLCALTLQLGSTDTSKLDHIALNRRLLNRGVPV